jgi:mono/diheme cytochrome c family protein
VIRRALKFRIDRRRRFVAAAIGGVLLAAVAGGAALRAGRGSAPPPAPAQKGPAPVAYDTHVRPLLSKYCYSCHGPKKAKANLDLSKFATEASVLSARKLWKRVLDQIQSLQMPPEDSGRPLKPADREVLASWIEAAILRPDPHAPPDPGRVVLRRLNRAEYRNTIRDLLGIELAGSFDPTRDFPSDDVGYGFDTIGDVLSIPPLLLEKYVAAAERILDRAIVTPEQLKPMVRRLEAEALAVTAGGAPDSAHMVLFANGELSAEVDVPKDGRYVLRVRAGGDQAGPEPARMLVRAGDRDLKTFDVTVPRDRMKVYEQKLELRAGKRRLAVAFVNDYYNPSAPKRSERDRNLVVDWLELTGPVLEGPPELPESHKRIFTAQPGAGVSKREAARRVLAPLAERAFRRPVAAEEVERLVSLFDLADAQGESFEAAMKVPLLAVLVSPHFLFRVERDGPAGAPRGVRPLDDWELATRLSYFLWSSMPDEELFALARQGRLRDPKTLDAQVDRMLRDPRARALSENFALQWLQLRRLEIHAPDPKRFPTFNEKLREAMRREVELLFDEIVREDRSVVTLLDADFTYVNEALARHYGIPGVRGDEMRRVALQDPRRGGILMTAGVLTVTSNPTRTSPVKRGKWVLEALLGTPPPPPLPDAGELKDEPEGAERLTVRQRLELHRADPNCAGCHKRMDPIGLGFENYDAIGRWRETEGRLPLDVSGTLVDGTSFNGPVELKKILLRRKDEFVRNLIEKTLTYALGRGVEYYDAPVVKEIQKSMAAQGYRFSALVKGVVRSYPFLHRRTHWGEVKDE